MWYIEGILPLVKHPKMGGITMLEDYMDHLTVGGDNNESIDRLLRMAEIAENESPKRSLEYAQEALEKSKESNYTLGLCFSLLRKGRIYWLLADHETASSDLLECLDLSKKNSFFLCEAEAYNCLGNIFIDIENYDKALENYMNALRICIREKFKELEGRIYNNIGIIYIELKDYDSANEYLSKSLSIQEAVGEGTFRSLLAPLVNLGELHFHKKNYAFALSYLERADEAADSQRDNIGKAQILQLKGKIFDQERQYEKAKETLETGLALASDSAHVTTIVLISIDLHKIYVQLGLKERAIEVLKEALNLAEQSRNWAHIFKVSLSYAMFYEKENNPADALHYYKKYYEAERNFENDKAATHLKNITSQFRIEQAQSEKELFRIKNIELKSKADELERKSLQIEDMYNQLQVISKIGQDITSSLDLTVILEKLYRHMNEVMDVHFCGIGVYDELTETILFSGMVENGIKLQKVLEVSIQSTESFAAWCLRNREMVVIGDAEKEHQKYATKRTVYSTDQIEMRSIIYVPLIVEFQLVGVLSVQSPKASAYSPKHIDLLKLMVNPIAIAVNNAAKSEKLEKEIRMRKEAQMDLEELSQRLLNLSQIDGLTGVSNRRRFDEYLALEWKRSLREGTPLTVMFIDVDYFKQYNDNYGHIQGDQCLIRVANTLRSCLKRGTDLIARFGGDEFVVLLGNTHEEGVIQVAETMRRSILELGIAHAYSAYNETLTITIGIASVVPSLEEDTHSIIEHADRALYQAKQSGRNCVKQYDF